MAEAKATVKGGDWMHGKDTLHKEMQLVGDNGTVQVFREHTAARDYYYYIQIKDGTLVFAKVRAEDEALAWAAMTKRYNWNKPAESGATKAQLAVAAAAALARAEAAEAKLAELEKAQKGK